MKKVRYGIVGLGNQGTHYAVKLFAEGKIENGVIGALCDIDPTRIEALRGKGNFADIPLSGFCANRRGTLSISFLCKRGIAQGRHNANSSECR